MAARLLVLAVMLCCGAYVAGASRVEVVPSRTPLAAFPSAIDGWSGTEAPGLDSNAVALLGVDDYLNRVYESRSGYVGLYIGYHHSQRQGDTLHSPLNCLPGSGWQPLSRTYLDVPLASGQIITINQYVIQKGLDRQVVLYWYQSHGRVIPNEYVGKMYTVYDALRLNRTDAAMIRVVSPILGSNDSGEMAAVDRAVSFVKAIFPVLPPFVPS